MAANAEVTLEQILNKLELIAEKLGEKTTARERQEENLRKYTERKDKNTPDASTNNLDKIAADVADVAKAARAHWIPTLTGSESKRFENIAKVYGKALKLSDNFTSIKQLLKNLAADKQSSKIGVKLPTFSIPTFNTAKIVSTIKQQYVKFGIAVAGAIGAMFNINWFETNTKNRRRFNWSKQFEPIKKFFNIGDKLKSINWFENIDWNWFETNTKNRRRFNWSKQFEPIKNFFNIGPGVAELNKQIKNFIDTTTKSIKESKFSTELKKYRDKLKEFGGSSSLYLKNLYSQISTSIVSLNKHAKDFIDTTTKSIKESKFSTELKKYRDKLKEFGGSSSLYVKNLYSQISTSVVSLNKQAGDFVDNIKKNVIEKYTSFKDSITKILPTFKKKEGNDLGKTTEKQSFADKFKNSAVGIAALGIGIALLVGAMIKCKVVDTKSVSIFAGLIAILGVAVWGLAKKSSEISKGAAAIALLSAAFGIVALSMKSLKGIKWDEIKGGLLAAGLTLTGLAGLAIGIGKFAANNMFAAAAGGAALLGLTAVIGMLGTNLGKFAEYDWKIINANLGMAVIAVTGFATLAGILGALMVGTEGVGALIAAGGIAAIAGIAKVIGYTGEQLEVYGKIDGDHLKKVGNGLKDLGIGIAAFFASTGIMGAAGVVGGVIQSISSWFDLDIGSQLKRYEQIDGTKIDILGKSLSSLANGFKEFASMSAGTKPFEARVDSLKRLEKLDIKTISSNLDVIASKLSNINNVSSKLSESSSKFNFEISGVSEMSQAITQMGKQEIDLLQQQLMILNDSRDLLEVITRNTSNMGKGGGSASSRDSSLSVSRENSTTRQSFFNNLKMMSTTLKD